MARGEEIPEGEGTKWRLKIHACSESACQDVGVRRQCVFGVLVLLLINNYHCQWNHLK